MGLWFCGIRLRFYGLRLIEGLGFWNNGFWFVKGGDDGGFGEVGFGWLGTERVEGGF